MSTSWDVIVVGAGAAGLVAAERAAESGRRTLLLEKNRKPGVKILMSGGTRCNITHATDTRGIVEAFGRQGRFLHSALSAFSPQDLVSLIEAEGVPTKVEETGKIFPVSNKAADVLGVFLNRLHRTAAEIALDEPLVGLRQLGSGFELSTPRRTLTADKLIITTGGQSYPGCGTTGDAYAWLADLGHEIVATRPALVPVMTDAAWVQSLKGVTVPDATIRVVLRDVSATSGISQPGLDERRLAKAAQLDERRGSFLFTHFGLSGPVVLDVSRAITAHPRPQTLALQCDFLPSVGEAALDDLLRRGSGVAGKKQLATILPDALPRRLGDALLGLAGLTPDHKAAELGKNQRAKLVQAIKRQEIPVSGTRGFAKAEVTAGGVSLEEVDSRTMQSKLVPKLYLAGEVLDLDGPIGGYNFQAAFSTGWKAGGSMNDE